MATSRLTQALITVDGSTGTRRLTQALITVDGSTGTRRLTQAVICIDYSSGSRRLTQLAVMVDVVMAAGAAITYPQLERRIRGVERGILIGSH
jgi:hypothetical protein